MPESLCVGSLGWLLDFLPKLLCHRFKYFPFPLHFSGVHVGHYFIKQLDFKTLWKWWSEYHGCANLMWIISVILVQDSLVATYCCRRITSIISTYEVCEPFSLNLWVIFCRWSQEPDLDYLWVDNMNMWTVLVIAVHDMTWNYCQLQVLLISIYCSALSSAWARNPVI